MIRDSFREPTSPVLAPETGSIDKKRIVLEDLMGGAPYGDFCLECLLDHAEHRGQSK